MQGDLVDFIVIGSMKSGTNALYNILRRSSTLIFASIKEPNYFCEAVASGGTWHNGDDWYRGLFGTRQGLRGEASTSYSKYPFFPGVAERVYMKAPCARLIYLIRDPIHRSMSHYLHNVLIGRENRFIREALLAENRNIYVDVSKYYMQLDQYLQKFSREQILIVPSEQLWRSPQNGVERICNFLGVRYSDVYGRVDLRTNHTVGQITAKYLNAPVNSAQGELFSICNRMQLPRSLSALDFAKALGFSASDGLRLAELLYRDVENLNRLLGAEVADWQKQFPMKRAVEE
jgi:hypothetical protein